MFLIIFDYCWLLLIIFDYFWIFLIIFDYFCLFLIIFDYCWLFLIIFDYFWLLLIIVDYILDQSKSFLVLTNSKIMGIIWFKLNFKDEKFIHDISFTFTQFCILMIVPLFIFIQKLKSRNFTKIQILDNANFPDFFEFH